MMFIKLGIGRAISDAAHDIRDGHITKEEGMALVKKYDHVIPNDLEYWLNYVNMEIDEFWEIANSFRDARVWHYENGKWLKDNIWEE